MNHRYNANVGVAYRTNDIEILISFLSAILYASAMYAVETSGWLAALYHGRRLHQLPAQPLRVGSDLAMTISVVHDLGIYIDLDVPMRSHVIKTTSACQIRYIRRSVPRTVLQTLASCAVAAGLL